MKFSLKVSRKIISPHQAKIANACIKYMARNPDEWHTQGVPTISSNYSHALMHRCYTISEARMLASVHTVLWIQYANKSFDLN